MDGGNILAPIISNPAQILEFGAGSGSNVRSFENTDIVGAWAVEVAEQYPTTQIIGLDLSPIQRAHIPNNCEFRVGDISTDLGQFHDGSVDLIHSRYLRPFNYSYNVKVRSVWAQERSVGSIYKEHFSHSQARNRMGSVYRMHINFVG